MNKFGNWSITTPSGMLRNSWSIKCRFQTRSIKKDVYCFIRLNYCSDYSPVYKCKLYATLSFNMCDYTGNNM